RIRECPPPVGIAPPGVNVFHLPRSLRDRDLAGAAGGDVRREASPELTGEFPRGSLYRPRRHPGKLALTPHAVVSGPVHTDVPIGALHLPESPERGTIGVSKPLVTLFINQDAIGINMRDIVMTSGAYGPPKTDTALCHNPAGDLRQRVATFHTFRFNQRLLTDVH